MTGRRTARIETVRTALAVVALRRTLARAVDDEGLDALVHRLAARPSRPPLLGRDLARGVRLGEAIANRLFPDTATCLYRALARFAVLRERGVDATFVLGVRRDAPKDGTGHAWVEDEAGAWGESIDDDEFVVTFSWP